MWPIRLRLLASLFLLGALLFPEPSRLQPTTPREHFVRGHVAAVVPVDQQKLRDIFLPHASVFLVRQNAMTTPVASAVTDLSGRFMIKTREIGVFLLCVEAQGFPRTCPDKVFRDPLPVTDAGTLRLPLFMVSPRSRPRSRRPGVRYRCMTENLRAVSPRRWV